MGLIAVAANPASGRDIRRIVSSATVFNNREKQNIVERMILAATQMGEHRFCIMPETFHFADRIREHLVDDFHAIPEDAVYTPEHFEVFNNQNDTTRFARYAEEIGADLLIVLGGDGTSRVAAKGIRQIPLLSVSTGTNNVFPEVVEGTVAGLAAAVLASKTVKVQECCEPCKRIEIYINGKYTDLALVDVVFSGYVYSGAKAIWSREDIDRVVVTQCHPAAIGFSAIPGNHLIVLPEEPFGAIAECGNGPANAKVSLAAGSVTPVQITESDKVREGEQMIWKMDRSGMLALDGEREVTYRAGDEVMLCIRRNGPLRVNIRKTLELAQQRGFFRN